MIFQRARAEAPCILILEDLDSLITDQNRSFFLNEVDGLEDNDGLLLVNSQPRFDPAHPTDSSHPPRRSAQRTTSTASTRHFRTARLASIASSQSSFQLTGIFSFRILNPILFALQHLP